MVLDIPEEVVKETYYRPKKEVKSAVPMRKKEDTLQSFPTADDKEPMDVLRNNAREVVRARRQKGREVVQTTGRGIENDVIPPPGPTRKMRITVEGAKSARLQRPNNKGTILHYFSDIDIPKTDKLMPGGNENDESNVEEVPEKKWKFVNKSITTPTLRKNTKTRGGPKSFSGNNPKTSK